MYLKNIEVYGFKSFAQKINFEFHNGITGIVGPNGSGKSNVGDAVRWVLGEQSARQLRGGNMQDVIFSGTETRKPLSYASVAITLDNGDHKLPVDYNEVTVTRRLYRSGESEYLINGSPCRLKDINEMFYDTGIGKEGYSIIGQGQIDRILSGKPEDRRELFDEAAGIVKFKRRKAATLKKLDEEKQNLVRVTDILGELTRQLSPLEKQSKAAKEYLSRRETLRELDVNFFLLEHENSGRTLAQLEEKYRAAEAELEENQRLYDQTRTEYERLEGELEELNRRMDALRDEIQQNALLRQQQEGQKNLLLEQLSSGRQNREHYEKRLQVIAGEIEKRESSREALQEEQEELKGNLRSIQKRLKSGEEELARLHSNMEACSAAVEDGKNEIIELLNSRATTRGEAQRFDTMMEQMNIKEAEISQRILNLKSEEGELDREREKVRARYDGITASITSMNEECARLDGEVHKLQEELKEQNSRMEIGQVAYHREESRLESLKNLTERYDGYGNSIRRVMEQRERTPGIRGVVADLLQVQKNYEVAVETALGGSIQNIVTDTQETARQMIEFLKKNKFGRATFLPMDSVSGKGEFAQKEALREPGVVGLASELVQAAPEYGGIIRYLLGRVLVVDRIDHAIAIGRKYKHNLRMVTLEGESFSPGGSMTGGAFKNSSNLLGRRREIEELEQSVRLLKTDMEGMQKAIDENRSRRNVLRDTIADIQEKLRGQYVAQNTARMSLAQLDEKEKEIRESHEQIRREQEEMKRQLEGITESHVRIEQELLESQRDEQELKAFIEEKQKEQEEWAAEEAAAARALEDIRVESAALEQKADFQRENLERLTLEKDTLAGETDEIREILSRNGEEMIKKEEEAEALKTSILQCQQKEEEGSRNLESLKAEQEEQNREHRRFFEKRDELSGRISLLDKECFRLKSQMEKEEERSEARISYLWEEYSLTPNAAAEFRKEELLERPSLRRDIARLKEEIRALGPVNVNAIEDYKELSERHAFLSGQYEDLVKAEETLEGIIRELDEGMRRQFVEKFQDIQTEFNKAFRELFGGGRGTLELSGDEDVLEAGIRIISQPPGKKLQNMMQLSGGEKALTAIALLFAIQNLKPSPFCLLDEIEAALDDSNVGRFAGYLKKLTKNTQFIIITHRRGTMSAADRLYGITMQEKGVSALVSVDLVEGQLSK